MSTTLTFLEENPIPFYADGRATIYQGSAQEIFPSLSLHHLDAVHIVTDPPYGIGLGYGDTEDNWRADREFWRLLYEHTPARASLHFTVSNRHLPHWIAETQAAGWLYEHCSVYWNMNRVGGNWGGNFSFAWEPWLSFSKGSFRLGKRMMTDVFKHEGRRSTDHPAERDLGAWTSFISHLPPGLIVDPFMGSGTTLRAALNLDRHAVGIEREQQWCVSAADRCRQLSLLVN